MSSEFHRAFTTGLEAMVPFDCPRALNKSMWRAVWDAWRAVWRNR